MSGALVSILIPTYNRAKWLAQAIDSALAQDYARLEVLVLDNASTDATPSLQARYATDARVRWIRNSENVGMVRNWRGGVELARGDWFMILSDDDFLNDAGYVRKAMTLAESDSSIVLVYAWGYALNERTGRISPVKIPFEPVNDGRRVFLSRNATGTMDFTLCNVLFPRALSLEEQAFSNPHNIGCDSELFLRLCLRGRVALVRDFASTYRWHSDNLIHRFQNDYELLLNFADWFMNPYLKATHGGDLPRAELDRWNRRVVRAEMDGILGAMRRKHPARLTEAVAALALRYGAAFSGALSWHQRLRLQLAGALPEGMRT